MKYRSILGSFVFSLASGIPLATAAVPPTTNHFNFDPLSNPLLHNSTGISKPIEPRGAGDDFLHFGRQPSPGCGNAYIRIQDGEPGPNTSGETRIVVKNEKSETVWLWTELNYNHLEEAKAIHGYPIAHPDGPAGRIKLTPGQSVEIGNIPANPYGPGAAKEKYSIAIRPYVACEENGWFGCAGDMGAKTKWEFSVDANGEVGMVAVNLSKVDALSAPGHFTYGAGSDCPAIGCHFTKSDLQQKCPAANTINDRGYLSCKSECAVTGDPAICCRTWDNCAPSSGFLNDICPDGYVYPGDNDQMKGCNPQGEIRVVIESD